MSASQSILPELAVILLAVASCAPQKPASAEPTPAPAPVTPVSTAPVEPVGPAAPPTEKIPLPDMLSLPAENEYRASNPQGMQPGGAVIARPPTEPPSRVKPPEKAAE